jgi:hypothetical protein
MKYAPTAVLLAVLFSMHLSSAYVPDYMTLMWNASLKESMSGMDLGDVNGDGAMEVIVSSSAEGVVYAYGPAGEVVWRFGVPGYVNFVKAVDIDGDNRSEVLTGSSDHLYVVNSSGVLLWKYYSRNSEVENAAVFDVDGDGSNEILFSAAAGCGDNVLYALNSSSRDALWQYDAGFYYPNVVRQVDAGGRLYTLVGMLMAPRGQAGCVPLSYKGSRVVALDGRGEVAWMFNTSGGVLDMKAGDVDGDGLDEIAVASMPDVYVLDFGGALKWSEDLKERVDGIALSAERGSRMRIMAATQRAYLLDPASDESDAFDTSDRAYSVASADLNNDGNPEYLVGSDRVYIYDYYHNLLWNSSRLVYVGYLFVANTDNLPDYEVVVGANKQVLVFKTGVRAKLQEADAYYGRAQQLYSMNDYSTALNNAMMARDIYFRFNDDAGLDNVRFLMGLINDRINSTGVISGEAVRYYDLSLSFYAAEDFINASLNAQIARAKYESVGNREGAAASEEIMNKSRELLSRNASLTASLAFGSFADGEYDIALAYAKDARVKYVFLRNSTEVSRMEQLISDINEVRKPPVSERITSLLDDPAVRRILYPSKYAAANVTVWLVYLIALGLALAGVQRAFSLLRERLSRKTLKIEKIAPEDSQSYDSRRQARFAAFFFLLAFLVVVGLLAYSLLVR